MAKAAQKRWTFRRREEIDQFWRSVRNVPARRRRSKRDEERFYLGLYLLALATHEIVTYPVIVEEDESPDFILSFAGCESIGVEATKATTQQTQISLTEIEDEYQRARAASNGEPEPVGRLVSFEGLAGDSVEKNWVKQIRDAIERKLKKLPKFRRAARYDLLIYDDTPYGPGDRVVALREVRKIVEKLRRGNSRLGKVSIIISLDVILDVGGECRVLPFINWSQPERTPDFARRVEHAAKKAAHDVLDQHESR
jgi:hypothetical protein